MTTAPHVTAGQEWAQVPLAPPRRRLHGLVWLGAWWARTRLDSELAEGMDPNADALRAHRAGQLTRARTRRRIARGIEQLVAESQQGWKGMSAGVPVRRGMVLGAQPTLLALARSLETPTPVAAHGVALALRLLTDNAGPLYFTGDARALADAAAAAIVGLSDGLGH